MKTSKEITFTLNEAEARSLLEMLKQEVNKYDLHELRNELKKFLGVRDG